MTRRAREPRVPRIARGLMRLYPAEFRRHYGKELERLLADVAQASPGGPVARAAFWIRVLADVAQSAVAERAAQLAHPSRTVLIRAAGISSVLGGAVFLAGMITPLRGPARAGVPASVVGMAAGAVGLYLALHGRSPRLERLGLALGAAGLALAFIGMAGSALGVVEPNPLAPIINTGEHAGLVFIGAGMSVWGILALRTHALGWLSFAPLPIGLLGLAGITFLSPNTFARLESGVVPLAFSAGWILLGLALLTSPPQRPQRLGRDTPD